MKIKVWKYVLTAILLLACALATRVGTWWWNQRQWFDLQQQQLATIERIGEFPPTGWDRGAWKNAVVTLCNVWGNVTFHPDHSKISNAEMQTLLEEFEPESRAARRNGRDEWVGFRRRSEEMRASVRIEQYRLPKRRWTRKNVLNVFSACQSLTRR